MSARTKMSKVFDHPVNLFLKVKVDNNWVDKEDRIKKAGY
ncbi:GTPase Era [Chlamydia trachomatis]|nr:GTPase Era [Chlamydia trachomatis]